NSGASPLDAYVRVKSDACGASCTSADVYQVRALETTGSVARYNNAGTQTTFLILQNVSDDTVAATVSYHDLDGTPRGTSAISLRPDPATVLKTSTVVGARAGAATVSHDGRFGALVGKTVALEPSTGFSFDTPMTLRPQ